MIQLPFSATAAAILLGAMVAGGAVGVATWSPDDPAPAPQASAAPSAPPAAAPATQEPSSEPRPQTHSDGVEQTAAEQPSPAPQDPDPSQQQVTVNQQVSIEQSESTTTTIVTAPTVVTGWGIESSCVGCVEHRNVQHPPMVPVIRPNQEHAVASPPRNEVPRPVHFVHRAPHIAVASSRRR